ncbi:hypothetical protein GCM10010106_21490 [Thermopolyspora flexuosa]|nr:hypothetical protein GCM10010106_21490 [Thermopolyspora flexuosa]
MHGRVVGEGLLDHRLRLVPPAHRLQNLGPVHHREHALGAVEPVLAGELLGLVGEPQRLLGAAEVVERVHGVAHRPQYLPCGAGPPADLQRAAVRGERVLQLAGDRLPDAQGEQQIAFQGLVADVAGDAQRLLDQRAALGDVGAEYQVQAEPFQRARPPGAGQRHQRDGPAQVVEHTPPPLLQRELGAADEQRRHPLGVGALVEQVERGVHEPGTALQLAAGERGLGGELQHGGLVGAEPFRGIGHLVPQRQHPLQELDALGVGEGLRGLGGGLPGGDERPHVVAGRVPVVGDLEGGPPGRHQRPVAFDLLGVPGVQPAVLPGQQLVVYGLADQRVPERVGAPVGDLDDVRGDRGPQRVLQVLVRQAGDGGEQGVPDAGAARRRDAQHALGRLGQPLERTKDEAVQRGGYRLAVVALGQRLDEQRDALAAVVHLADAGVRGGGAEDPGHLGGDLVAGEPRQLQPEHAVEPGEPGEHRAQRMLPVQLVGAVGEQHEHLRREQVAAEERDQVAAGTVRPVHVLDDEQHRALLGEPFQQGEELLEEPGPAGVGLPVARRLAELGQQPGEVAGGAVGQQRGDLARTSLPDELAQHGGERGVGEALGGELDAAADEHPGLPLGGELGEPGDEPGLADPGLAADEHGRRLAVPCPIERVEQRGQLFLSPDENGAHRPAKHALQLVTHGLPVSHPFSGTNCFAPFSGAKSRPPYRSRRADGPAGRETPAGWREGAHDRCRLPSGPRRLHRPLLCSFLRVAIACRTVRRSAASSRRSASRFFAIW